jgi:hypothetical protein
MPPPRLTCLPANRSKVIRVSPKRTGRASPKANLGMTRVKRKKRRRKRKRHRLKVKKPNPLLKNLPPRRPQQKRPPTNPPQRKPHRSRVKRQQPLPRRPRKF